MNPQEATMSDQQSEQTPMADDAYQPTGGNEEQEDAGPLDLQDAVGERTYDDMLDEGYPRPSVRWASPSTAPPPPSSTRGDPGRTARPGGPGRLRAARRRDR